MEKPIEEIAEYAWDKFSQHIDDDLFSLETVANTSIITRSDFIKSLKWSQEQLNHEWVSVSDGLPEIGQYVQAAIPGGVLLYSCVLEKNVWYGYGNAQPETRITHWKPLPTAPIAKEADNG